MTHPVDMLEPECLSDTNLLPKRDSLKPDNYQWWELRIQMSQAISLKRIADRLDKLGVDKEINVV